MTRPRPSNVAETIPESAAGTNTRPIVWNRFAPRAYDASLNPRGTFRNASSERVKMVGTAIRASKHPAVKTFRRSLIGKNEIQWSHGDWEAARMAWPTTAIPKKPSTTDGMAEKNSI